MPNTYKLKILNGVLKLKTLTDYTFSLLGIKDLGTQTGNVSSGYVDWSIQHLTKTTAEWNADTTTILLRGQLGLEDTGTTSFKIKIGNGIDLWSGLGYAAGGGATTIAWGAITGTLANQPDLQNALDAKQDSLGYTPENVANKSSSYTVSSTTTYANTKALVDGLATKQDSLGYTAENAANKTDLMSGNTTSSTKYLSAKGVYDWAIATFQAISSNLTSWASITRASGFDTFVATPNSANLAALITDEGTAFNKNFGTGTTNIVEIGSTLGNSLITSTDANGKLQTLSTTTYPSLTELSYVKNVTSAIQTQLDTKATFLVGEWYSDATAVSPADGSVYYFGTINNNAPETANTYRIKSPKTNARWLVTCTAMVRTALGSAQNATVKIQNITQSTEDTISTAFAATDRINSVTGQSTLASTAGDEMTIQITNPSWVSNPTGVQYQFFVKAY